jgi:hypothetical protein
MTKHPWWSSTVFGWRKKPLPWVLFACFLLAAEGAHGEVEFTSWVRPDQEPTLYITGTISKADVKAVATAIKSIRQEHQPFGLKVWLDSDGGDVEAAMAIGRLIRLKTAEAVVLPSPAKIKRMITNATCASACVLILTAGSFRVAMSGQIGIHRPYSAPSDPTQDTRSRYSAIVAKVKAYLEEMGMPSQLYEAMMQVPPQEVRWLTSEELTALGLLGMDASYADLNDTRTAFAHGLPKEEYLRRKALMYRRCPIPDVGFSDEDVRKWDQFTQCQQRILNTGRP